MNAAAMASREAADDWSREVTAAFFDVMGAVTEASYSYRKRLYVAVGKRMDLRTFHALTDLMETLSVSAVQNELSVHGSIRVGGDE